MELGSIMSEFINQYHSKDNILGIIFYGSSNYKTDTLQSDIDLLFITDGDKNYKGTTYIGDKKIEYFEKNIYYLMEKIDELESSPDRSLMSIFVNGSIIYSKDNMVEYLKEEIMTNQKYVRHKRNRKCLEQDLVAFYECLQGVDLNNCFFQYVYYNLLEAIRKRYHEENGCSKLPSLKACQLYSDPYYALEFYCVTLPSKQFIDLYLDLFGNGYEQKKFDLLCSMARVEGDAEQDRLRNHSKVELKYISTIVKNMVDKTSYYLEQNNVFSLGCYYITLERIRKLYCYINQIDDSFKMMSKEYDVKFLELFDFCIKSEDRIKDLNNLFDYVVGALHMDYRNYKILELS